MKSRLLKILSKFSKVSKLSFKLVFRKFPNLLLKFRHEHYQLQDHPANYKKWVFIFLTPIFLTLFSVLAFNIIIDKGAYFSYDEQFKAALKALLEGNIVAELQVKNERILNEYIINNIEHKIDAIAVGSSRTMLFRKRYLFDDANWFFNHSMPRCTLGDYLAIIGAYKSLKGYIPKTVVIGLDPWIFNKNSRFKNSWVRLKEYYFYLLGEIGIKKTHYHDSLSIYVNAFDKLLSWNYVLSNINFINDVLWTDKKYFYIAKHIGIGVSLIEPDGSFHYPDKYLYRSDDLVQKEAENIYHSAAGLEYFWELENRKLFEMFIEYLQQEGTNIIFFLPPYHPTSYKNLISSQNTKIINDIEEYLGIFAKQKDIRIVGSYNPQKYNLSNKDFIDGFHTRSYVIKNIFSTLKR